MLTQLLNTCPTQIFVIFVKASAENKKWCSVELMSATWYSLHYNITIMKMVWNKLFLKLATSGSENDENLCWWILYVYSVRSVLKPFFTLKSWYNNFWPFQGNFFPDSWHPTKLLIMLSVLVNELNHLCILILRSEKYKTLISANQDSLFYPAGDSDIVLHSTGEGVDHN